MNELEFFRNLYFEDLDRDITFIDENNARITKRRIRKKLFEQIVNVPMNEQSIERFDKVFVWSDTHFGHKNIISFCERPFENVDQMDQHLIDNFNEYVGPNDCSIWVGDVSFYRCNKTNEILDQLNGYKILITGNHDFERGANITSMNFDEIHPLFLIDDVQTPLIFTHYPMYNLIYPWFNICGHIHNGQKANESLTYQHINVSCEMLNYKPIELKEIMKMVKTRFNSIEEKDIK